MTTDTDKIKFRVETDDIIGRFAVASEQLNAGDLIFTEKPFAFGPKSETFVLCLGCYDAVDGTTRCTNCGWPVCGNNCESLPAHKEAECRVFSTAGVKFAPVEDASGTCLQYECITPLRVLLAKEANPKRWESEVAPMEHHNKIRKNLPIWHFNQVNVVEFLRGPCKLDCFPEDLIHTVCGILDVNAFEARSPNGQPIRCLYPKLAILSHNCVSNITHSIATTGSGDADDYELVVRAAVEVPDGHELHSSYTYPLWPTIVRREFLKESKHFACACARCTDPTELGTNLSTLKCNKCDNGVIRSTDPLDAEASWKCTHCAFTTRGDAVRQVFQAIQIDLDSVEASGLSPQAIEAREQLFRKYRSVLHPRNAYMTMLRVALGSLYGKAEGYTLEDLPDLLLERKVELCREVLAVVDVVEPGLSRIRGMTLYELHAPLMFLARNAFNADLIGEEEYRKRLNEALGVLEESVGILTLEPASTSEGSVGLVGKRSLEQIRGDFDAFVENF